MSDKSPFLTKSQKTKAKYIAPVLKTINKITGNNSSKKMERKKTATQLKMSQDELRAKKAEWAMEKRKKETEEFKSKTKRKSKSSTKSSQKSFNDIFDLYTSPRSSRSSSLSSFKRRSTIKSPNFFNWF